MIPIGTSLLYVEPVYLEATNQAIPEVKRVIVAYQDKIAYEPTLGEALLSLFGGDAGDSGKNVDGLDGGDSNDDVAALIKKAQNAYDKAIECQKNGDWEGYGKYIRQLENYLTKLANESGTSAQAAAPAEEPAAADEQPAAEAEDEAA